MQCQRTHSAGNNTSKRPVDPFSAKMSIIRSKRPLVKQKCPKRPGHTVNAPPFIFLGERPGAELASRLSDGNGAVSKADKGVLYIGRCLNMGRCMCCATATQIHR